MVGARAVGDSSSMCSVVDSGAGAAGACAAACEEPDIWSGVGVAVPDSSPAGAALVLALALMTEEGTTAAGNEGSGSMLRLRLGCGEAGREGGSCSMAGVAATSSLLSSAMVRVGNEIVGRRERRVGARWGRKNKACHVTVMW